MDQATQERVRQIGQEATNGIWQEFKAKFPDEATQKAAHEIVAALWKHFKAQISTMAAPGREHEFYRLDEMVTQISIAYEHIIDDIQAGILVGEET